MSGGVVFATSGGAFYARFGAARVCNIGDVIPPGMWYLNFAWQITCPDASVHPFPAGYCVSDGRNTAATAAGLAIPIGAR